MAASSKTLPYRSKGPQKLKNPLQVPVFPGAVRCVIIPKVKNHQTQLHSTQSWSATGLRGRKIKIICGLDVKRRKGKLEWQEKGRK
ncbi:hypothetical protein TNCV_3937961 [Trichonephila clavipes]|nr:hypothetical protein TNCV_3937961 [Trichonephila clavipes]